MRCCTCSVILNRSLNDLHCLPNVNLNLGCLHSIPDTRGGISLYKPYRYVPPQRVWFLRRFGLKTGIHFAHFGLESGIVFEKTTGGYESINRRFQFQVNNKEREMYVFLVDFKKSFLLAFYSK